MWNSVKRLGKKSFRLCYVTAILRGIPRHAMKAYREGLA